MENEKEIAGLPPAEYRRRWAQKNPEKARLYYQTYCQKNLEKIRRQKQEWREKNRDLHNLRSRAWRKRNPRKVKDIQLRYRRGISIGEFESKLAAQSGVCAICRENPATSVDHSHKTQKVRGILCHGCNAGLGFFKESPQSLLSALEYLKTYAD